MAHQRQLEVMNDDGAVHGDGRHDSTFHEIDDDGSESDLDDMRAHAQDDRPAPAVRANNRLRHFAERLDRQDIRKGVQKCFKGAAALPDFREIAELDFAVAALERIGLETRHVDGLGETGTDLRPRGSFTAISQRRGPRSTRRVHGPMSHDSPGYARSRWMAR